MSHSFSPGSVAQWIITGTYGSPQVITAAGGIALIASVGLFQMWYLSSGSGGAITITANPSITVGASDGQLLRLVGTDDTNTVTIPGNSLGCSLNGDCTLGQDDWIEVFWSAGASKWLESSRRR